MFSMNHQAPGLIQGVGTKFIIDISRMGNVNVEFVGARSSLGLASVCCPFSQIMCVPVDLDCCIR